MAHRRNEKFRRCHNRRDKLFDGFSPLGGDATRSLWLLRTATADSVEAREALLPTPGASSSEKPIWEGTLTLDAFVLESAALTSYPEPKGEPSSPFDVHFALPALYVYASVELLLSQIVVRWPKQLLPPPSMYAADSDA